MVTQVLLVVQAVGCKVESLAGELDGCAGVEHLSARTDWCRSEAVHAAALN